MFSTKVPEFPWLGVRTAARFALCVLVDALLPSMLLPDGEGCPLSSPPLLCTPWWLGGTRPCSGSPASPDEKELPHLGAGPERPGPLEKKKSKDPHTRSLPFSYSQREQRMGSASCAEPRRRRGEVLSYPAHHRLSLWRKERAPGRSSAPQYGQYFMAGILRKGHAARSIDSKE